MVRTSILLLVFNFQIFQIISQNRCDSVDKEIFGGPEAFPIFKKSSPSIENLFLFINENLIYPETAKRDFVEGRVFIRFWIDTTGNTCEHEIIQSVRKDLDDEALRIAKLIKFDIPAMSRGEPIGYCFNLTIAFKLVDEKVKKPRKIRK